MEFDKANMKNGVCKLQLNSISTVDNDPTLLKCSYSILDFNESGNKQIVPKELALEAAPTLKGKPLLCVYSQNTSTDTNNPNDHFNNHGQMIKKDRYGNEYIGSNSIAIGSALEEGYLTTIKDDNGNDIEVIGCDFYLWVDRNIEIIQLIEEIYNSGLPLYSSCEYWYSNYEVNNGVQTLKSPLIFSGHCLLGSGENGSVVVAPAYDSSKLLSINEKFNNAVGEAIQKSINSQNENIDINNNSKKEVDVMAENTEMFKKVCELSFSDIHSLIYGQLRGALSENEYDDSWITETYESYFILSYWNEDTHKYFKVNYTKTDEAVTIDWENRTEVYLYQEWREIPDVQTALNELNLKVDDLTKQVNSANESIGTLTTEKENLTTQFNNASEKVTSLNALVEEYKPFKEQAEQEKYNKAINDKKELYLSKFNAVGAKEKFESEDVQNLIKLSINDNEEGKNAIFTLNSILVDLVQVKSDEKPIIKEFASKQTNLIPTASDFDSRYSE